MHRIQTYILLFLIFGSALAINPWLTTDIFEFPKFLVLIVAVSALTVTVVLQPVRLPKIFGWLAVFFAGNVIAYIFSTDQKLSLAGAPMRFQGFLTQIYYALLAVGSFHFFKHSNTSEQKKIWKGLIIATTIACFAALLPYVIPLPFLDLSFFSSRAFGTFGNPNYLAAFLIGVLPLFFFILHKKTILFWPLMIFVLATLFLTGSRSAWGALLFAFFIWTVLGGFLQTNKKILPGIGATVALLFTLVLVQHFFPSPALERFSLTGKVITSIQTRVELWRSGARLFLKRPLTGYGQDNIKGHIEAYLPERLQENEVFFIDRTHSELLDIFATIGLIGGIGYIGFFGTVFWKGVRLQTKKQNPDPFMAAAFIGGLAIFLFHLVNFGTLSSNILLYLFAGFFIARQSPPI